MKKSDYVVFLVFILLLIIDIAISSKVLFFLSLSFLSFIALKGIMDVKKVTFLLLIIDLMFGSFISEFSLPVILGVLIFFVIERRIKIPVVFGVFFISLFLFLSSYFISRNLNNSVMFSLLTFFCTLLLSTIRIKYETTEIQQ